MAMSTFWLGTVPLLAGLGVGVQTLAGPMRRHLPKLTAVALVVVGLVAVARHAVAPLAGHQRAQGGACCHDP
jgi:sulfite exporter TauE/SafE